MSATKCCVRGCVNDYKHDKKIPLHHFPIDPTARTIWINQINKHLRRNGFRGAGSWMPTKHSRICGKHFSRSGCKTERDRFPILFPRRKTPITYINDVEITPEQLTIQYLNNVLHDHTYCLLKSKVEELKNGTVELGTLMEDLENKISQCEDRLIAQDKQIAELSHANLVSKRRHNRIRLRSFSYEEISHNSKALLFYTGFRNETGLKQLMDFLRPSYNQTLDKVCLSSALTMEEQLFMVLCRLKLGLLDKDLSFRFLIPPELVNSLWKFWIGFLDQKLANRFMPSRFMVIDTVCLKTDTGFDSTIEAKGLIAVSSDRLIRFVSDLYPPNQSNREIIKLSGVLETLERNTYLVTDKEFDITDMCRQRSIKFMPVDADEKDLQTPPIMTCLKKAVKSIKTFRILQSYYDSTFDDLNSVWKICCYLSKFTIEPSKCF